MASHARTTTMKKRARMTHPPPLGGEANAGASPAGHVRLEVGERAGRGLGLLRIGGALGDHLNPAWRDQEHGQHHEQRHADAGEGHQQIQRAHA